MNSILLVAAEGWQWLKSSITWDGVKSFGNSAFTTSLVGALAGAYFGARSAQYVAERGKLRDEFTKEIRNVNAGIALAFGIVNSLLTLKKQHVVALKAKYDDDRSRYDTFVAKRKAGEIDGNERFEFSADFGSLPQQRPPVPILQEVIFSRLSAVGRPLNLVATLGEAVENLNSCIARRNELIDTYKAGQFPAGANVVHVYFALPYGNGNVNKEYQDLVGAIASYNDDAIFFGHLLCQDLSLYGTEVAKAFKKKLKETPPRVTEVDFRQAEESRLLPNHADYQAWTKAFHEVPRAKKRWWKRSDLPVQR